MENKQYLEKIKEALKDIDNVAEYVGEDGGMVTNCGNKREALKRFIKLNEESDGMAERIKLEDIKTAYFHLALEVSKEKMEDMNIEDDGWFITTKKPSPIKVWYYSA